MVLPMSLDANKRLVREFLDHYASAVKKVTPADVQRVARKYATTVRTVIVKPN